jgi:hypothetical protein
MIALAQPPAYEVGDTEMYVTLAVLVAVAVALGAFCVARAVRERDPVPVFALLGGVVALPIEPLWDVVVRFVFPFNTDPIAFTAFDRPIPLYLAFIYPAFIGWGSYLGYRLIRGGATTSVLMRLPVVFLVADAAIEIAGIRAGVWHYYGGHSWTLFAWPLYFGVLNGTIPLLGGFLLHVLEPRLHGVSKLGLLFVVPTAYAGIYAAAGWPTWAALNADVPASVTWLAGAVTMLLCVGVWRLIAAEAATVKVPETEPSPLGAVRVGMDPA